MRARRLGFYVASLVLGATLSCSREPAADLILAHGVVHTFAVSDASAPATAIAISGDRIVFVGDDAGARKRRGPNTRWIDLGGKTVLPGLVDAHGHLDNFGRMLEEVQLVGATSRDDVLARVREAQSRVGSGQWIHGRGWDQNDWPNATFPSWRDLAGTEANPVYLERVDGHAMWLNKTALEACGITRATADPPGGRIVHDAGGEPTGIFIDNAEHLIESQVPPATNDDYDRRLAKALAECNRLGLVGVHEAATSQAVLASLRRLGQQEKLTLNVYCLLDSDQPDLVRTCFAHGPSSEFGGGLVVRAVKLRADGALGSRGAALLRPFEDDRGIVGLEVDPPDSLLAWTRASLRAGSASSRCRSATTLAAARKARR